jgi:hypothetical protein
MSTEPDSEPPLPPGWLRTFIDKADLAASYDALSGCTHFYAETMRGRIRALELKLDEAAKHFEQAEGLFAAAPRTTPNLLRGFLLSIYAFDFILLSGPLDPALGKTKAPIAEISDKVLTEHPEVSLAFEYRKSVEALFCLHVGEAVRAQELYRELLDHNPRADPEQLARYNVGLAAAQHNLSFRKACLESLECAGLCLQASTKLLPQAQVAGMLRGSYAFLGLTAEAQSWEQFLGRLPCPAPTREAFLRRGELSTLRSLEVARLVFF